MFEFARTTAEVSFEGKTYTVRLPSEKEKVDYFSKSSGAKESKESLYEAMSSFIEKMGLPKEVIDNLESEHLTSLIEFMILPKKK